MTETLERCWKKNSQIYLLRNQLLTNMDNSIYNKITAKAPAKTTAMEATTVVPEEGGSRLFELGGGTEKKGETLVGAG
jgi:hypothetical protein